MLVTQIKKGNRVIYSTLFYECTAGRPGRCKEPDKITQGISHPICGVVGSKSNDFLMSLQSWDYTD